uniref:15-hydroxyprostaglandin dehydrogenase [NAD(+)] n=1 Tax=Triatoma infestans TaxID=30076 RepID=A0A023FB52_TRIIF
MELKGAVALVTGAAQGIGKACVDYLLAEGVKVMITDISKTVGEATEKEMATKHGESNVEFIYCDVTNDECFEDSFKETIKKFDKLDLLINNAGIANELMDDGWKQTIQINFIAVVKGTYLGMKYMGKHEGKPGGTIVNIGSMSSFVPFESTPVYSATKAAVNQFSRSISTKLHYDRTGVRVISVNPAFTDTAILPAITKQIDKSTKTSFLNAWKEHKVQSVDNMGKGMITVLKKAEPGSLWVIQDDVAPKRIELKVIKHDN